MRRLFLYICATKHRGASGRRYRAALNVIARKQALLADTEEVSGDALCAATLRTLERRLVLRSDEPEIIDYVCGAYRRVRATPPLGDDPCQDIGHILARNGRQWLALDGKDVDNAQEKPTTHFRLAFYGASKLIRLSLRRSYGWHSLYGAALRVGKKAIIVSAQSGIGKTTLALELMARGAGFYSDEFVHIKRGDRTVSGLPRALLIRQRTLSVFRDARLKAVCEASSPRMPHGDPVWDNIDPGDVFGEHIFAQPAPLSAAIVLERGLRLKAVVERIPAALAAADFNKRMNADSTGFDRLADTALMLAGVPCYHVAANSPQSAADAIEGCLR